MTLNTEFNTDSPSSLIWTRKRSIAAITAAAAAIVIAASLIFTLTNSSSTQRNTNGLVGQPPGPTWDFVNSRLANDNAELFVERIVAHSSGTYLFYSLRDRQGGPGSRLTISQAQAKSDRSSNDYLESTTQVGEAFGVGVGVMKLSAHATGNTSYSLEVNGVSRSDEGRVAALGDLGSTTVLNRLVLGELQSGVDSLAPPVTYEADGSVRRVDGSDTRPVFAWVDRTHSVISPDGVTLRFVVQDTQRNLVETFPVFLDLQGNVKSISESEYESFFEAHRS